MSSFDNKFNFYGVNGSNTDSSGNNSRTANTLARIAFNLYGSSTTPSNNSSNTSISPNRNINSKPPFTKSPSYNSHKSTEYSDLKNLRYNANYEMSGFSILNNDLNNQVVLAGKNSLQVLNIDENKIIQDLLEGSQSIKNKKLMGSILDVSSGFQNYNRFVAASTTTGSILIFDYQGAAKADKLSYKLANHTRAVNSISFSPLDPHLLVSGSQDGAMKLWDLRSSSMKPILTMIGNSDGVRSLKFSPFHNKKFVAIFDSGVIQKWDIRNNQQFEKKFNAHTGPGLTVDWHPDWDYIVSGGRDKQIQVWNMSSADQRQIPDHVIHTAFPISKVSFRPNHSSNINSAEIATSFLANDLGVEIYSLKRKFIPLYHIQSHSAQITGLNFLNDRYILTSSKDKSFIMDDVTNYPPRILDLSVASTSWMPGGNFCFTNQSLENHSIEENYEQPLISHSQSNPNNTFSTSPTYNTGLLMTTPTSVSSYNDSTSPRPGISRASSQFVAPSLNRNQSTNTNNSYSPGFYRASSTVTQQLQNQSVINPIVVPVGLPIIRTPEVLKYLVDNYRFNSEGDLIEACDFNSEVAASVHNLRDSKTWKVIKESLIWESKLEQELIYNEKHFPQADLDIESLRSADINENHLDSDKYNYSTSNSTAYGKSPSLSDINNISSSMRHNHAPSVSSYRMSNLKQSILKSDSENTPITEEGEEIDIDANKTVTKDDVLKWQDTLLKPNITDLGSNLTDKDQEEVLDFVEGTIPITKPRAKRSSMRLITDDLSARSLSPSYSMGSLTSSTSQALFKSKPLPLSKSVIPQPSILSELTRQLTNQDRIDQVIENAQHSLLPPFTPRFLIEKVIHWNLEQGDVIMSAVLIILFNPKYKIYPKNSDMLNEIIYGYLEWLQRTNFFIKFTEINQILIRDGVELDICKTSVTSSGIRHFCSSCNKLIVNEASKAKIQETINKGDDSTEPHLSKFVGSWFCELCSSWNRCIFCNEVVKGLTLIKLKCGHNGHFGCLKAWFLGEEMSECPGGCY